MAVDALIKLTNPSLLPTGVALCAAWGGNYLVVGQTTTPRMHLFKRTENTLARLTFSPGLFSAVTQAAWSGDYLAVNASYNLHLYKRSGDTLTKLATPEEPPADVNMAAWSGNYLALATEYHQGVKFFRRDDDELVELTHPAALYERANACAWNGDYLAVVCSGSTNLILYKRNGDTLTRLANPTQPGSEQEFCVWSGQHLVVGSNFSPVVHFYKLVGDALTKLTSPPNLAGNMQGCGWRNDHLVITIGTSTPLLYKRTGDTLAALAAQPAADAALYQLGVGGDYLAFPLQVSPFLSWYQGPDQPATGWAVPSLALSLQMPAPTVEVLPKVRPPTMALALSMPAPVVAIVVPPSAVAGTATYALTLTGTSDGQSDIALPLVSVSGRMRSGEPSYLQVVLPGSAAVVAAVAARPQGQLVLSRGLRLAGVPALELVEIARVNLATIADDQGAMSRSITLVGYRQTTNAAPKSRKLAGVSYIRRGSGKRRVRSLFDQDMRPGDVVSFGDESLVVGLLSYQLAVGQEVMEITEA